MNGLRISQKPPDYLSVGPDPMSLTLWSVTHEQDQVDQDRS